MPFFAQQMGATPFMLGLIYSMFSAGNVVGSTFLGWFSDKVGSILHCLRAQIHQRKFFFLSMSKLTQYGRKPTMVIGLFGSALGYALLVFSTSVWQVIGAR